MEIDLFQFGKNYILFTKYLFNVVLVIGLSYIALLFLADEETTGIAFLVFQMFSSLTLLFLPVGIILAIIAKTRKLGGAFLYFIATTFLAYYWVAGLFLLHQKSGTAWAVIGIILSFFTGGFGLFFLAAISAVLHNSWTGVFIFVGIPLLCKGVMNFSKALMEITPAQIEEKIKLFEREQETEIQAMDEKIRVLETEQSERKKRIAIIDEELEEFDEYEDYLDDDLEDEEYEDLNEEEIKLKIKESELEIKRLEKEIAEGQRKEAKVRDEIVGMIFEKPALAEAVYEAFEEKELEDGTAEKYSRDALIEWRNGNREKALTLYDKALEINPDDAIDLMNRGNLQIEIGNFDEGISDLENASKINPTLPTHNAILFKNMSAEMREGVRQRMLEKDNSES